MTIQNSTKNENYSKRIVEEEERPASVKAIVLSALLVAVAATIAYHNSFRAEFVLDDLGAIRDNTTIADLWSRQVLTPPGHGTTVQGRPVLNLSFAINRALFGTSVASFHAGNFLLHVAAGLVLLGVVGRTLRRPAVPRELRQAATAIAAASALVWVVHPLTTNAVTYLSQRAESQASLFYLLTIYLVIRCAESPAAKGARLWAAVAVAACGLGMGTKEIMVSAPLAAILYDRLFLASSWGEVLRRRWGLYVGLAATWGILIADVLSAGSRGGTAGLGGGVSPWEYAATQAGAIVMYLKLCFWPAPLVFDYGDGLVKNVSEIVPQAIAIGVLLALVAAGLWRRPRLAILGVIFFAVLAPSSSFVPSINQTISEYRMYLPLAAVVVLAMVALYEGARVFWERQKAPADKAGQFAKVCVLAAGAVAACVLCGVTIARNTDYRTNETLWQDTIDKRPENWRAYWGLGTYLYEHGAAWESIPLYNRAIELKPTAAMLYDNRADSYVAMRKEDAALADFTRAIELRPDFALAYNNRALIYQNRKQYEKAMADFDKAIESRPDFALGYNNRGSLYFQTQRYQEGLADCTRALGLDPGMAMAYNNRAACYFGLREYDQAWQDVAACQRAGGQPSAGLLEMLRKASGRND